jgi:thiamine transport system substrate-binding protein
MHSHAFESRFSRFVQRRVKAALRGLVFSFCLLAAAGCGTRTAVGPNTPSVLAHTAGTPRKLTVMTHDSFAVSDSVLKEFEQAENAIVSVIESGDAGAALNKAILTKQVPIADVFFGVDNTLLTRALEAEIFETYASPRLEKLPAEFKLDGGNRALPVDYGFVCINYDIAWFDSHSLAVSQSLEDLARPEYKGLLVVEDPSTSSPGLAFLLATVAHFGANGFPAYWKSLKDNQVQVVDGWETAYYTNFSGSSGHGEQPMVVSYASSPAFEMIYADPPRSDPPTASLTGPDMCFRQIEFAGILAGTTNRDLARAFVDFMLSMSFQEDIPMQMAMFPVLPQAEIPEEFKKYAQIPDQPAVLSPEDIASHREEWVNQWRATVLG